MQNNVVYVLVILVVLSLPVMAQDSKFEENVPVRLRVVNDIINGTTDGIIELYINNPYEVNLNVDIHILLPSGIHIYGPGFDRISTTGTYFAKYDMPPGQTRTIYLDFKSEKYGTFYVDIRANYWPENNKNDYRVITQNITFIVKELSVDPKNQTVREKNYIYIDGEQTDVEIGEDLILKLHAENIAEEILHLQSMINLPIYMGIHSSDFDVASNGARTKIFNVYPGESKNVEIRIYTWKVGNFAIKTKLTYYYGNDTDNASINEKKIYATVRPKTTTKTILPKTTTKTILPKTIAKSPGFEFIIAMIILIIMTIKIRN